MYLIYLFIEIHKRSRENIWHFFVALSLTIMNRNEGKKFEETFTFVSGLISLFMDKRKTVLEFPTTLDLGCLIMTSSTTTEQPKQQQQQARQRSESCTNWIVLWFVAVFLFYVSFLAFYCSQFSCVCDFLLILMGSTCKRLSRLNHHLHLSNLSHIAISFCAALSRKKFSVLENESFFLSLAVINRMCLTLWRRWEWRWRSVIAGGCAGLSNA